jgi:hypothetical protein
MCMIKIKKNRNIPVIVTPLEYSTLSSAALGIRSGGVSGARDRTTVFQ